MINWYGQGHRKVIKWPLNFYHLRCQEIAYWHFYIKKIPGRPPGPPAVTSRRRRSSGRAFCACRSAVSNKPSKCWTPPPSQIPRSAPVKQRKTVIVKPDIQRLVTTRMLLHGHAVWALSWPCLALLCIRNRRSPSQHKNPNLTGLVVTAAVTVSEQKKTSETVWEYACTRNVSNLKGQSISSLTVSTRFAILGKDHFKICVPTVSPSILNKLTNRFNRSFRRMSNSSDRTILRCEVFMWRHWC
jgi:hypothetical protein